MTTRYAFTTDDSAIVYLVPSRDGMDYTTVPAPGRPYVDFTYASEEEAEIEKARLCAYVQGHISGVVALEYSDDSAFSPVGVAHPAGSGFSLGHHED